MRPAETSARAEENRSRLAGAFAELSAQALAKNNEQFLALADTRFNEARAAARGDLDQRQTSIAQLLTPLSDTLARYERGIQQMEAERRGAYAGLSEKVAQLHVGHQELQRETRNLVTALRAPQTRGRWGEMQLRRVAEMAGMLEHCDFEEQVTTSGEDGRLRPDMVVHMPGGGQVVVDAKVPLDAFLQLVDADDDEVSLRCTGPATPGSSAPTSSTWRRRSTGGNSTGRRRWSSPSYPATSCSPQPSRPTLRSRSTRWRTTCCSPPRSP